MSIYPCSFNIHINFAATMTDQNRYDLRGVSSSKDDVHKAIKHLDKGLYPMAFCKILPDLSGDPEYCCLMHADTAGTKTSLAYVYWKETGDLSVWKGIAQDAIMMNLDDMACVGCYNNILLSSTIGRNKKIIDGDVVASLIQATVDIADQLKKDGVLLHLAGGETADVGDIVRTVDVGYTAYGRLRRSDVLANDIKAGDVIVGLASYGQASYETEYNGGMGSNGLTSARHDVFSHEYAEKYPESYNPLIPDEVVYTGSKKLTDTISIDGKEITLGKLVLSPTRTYLPVIKVMFEQFREGIHGMIHCTGGGQVKVSKFIKNKRVVKNNLLEIPPLFKLIQSESGTSWKEMYEVFNMGHRLEVYCDQSIAQSIIDVSKSFNIDAQIIGHVEEAEGEHVHIHSPQGNFEY